MMRLLHRIGHRGAFLAFLALLDFLYGYSLFVLPRDDFHAVLPIHVWAYIWIVAGVFCLVGTFLKHDRVPFAAAATIKAGWATAWLKIWLFNPEIKMAWVSVSVWFAFSALVVIVSTWPETRRHDPDRVEIRTRDTVEIPVIVQDDDENHNL